MSESGISNAGEQPQVSKSENSESAAQLGVEQQVEAHQPNIYTIDLSTETVTTRPLFIDGKQPVKPAPAWLRPFLSLRIQLTFVFCLLLILTLMLSSMLYSQSMPTSYMTLASIGVIALGTALAFILTSLLLRPLSRVTDAAQAIAMGDLAQRERLPLRLPPQDEIDRLAGSLDEMVTRLERAEELQHASEESFTRFFSDASHQLRTPLTSLRGFTEVLMRGANNDPETAQRVLKLMKNEAERMTFLINDLLTLARLGTSVPMKTQYIDLVEVATEGIEQTRRRAKDGRTISFSVETTERLGLQADGERLKQLFFVLLDNALKYGRSTPDGRIDLQLDRQDNHAIISVSDNGDGIAKGDLAHIFDSFYRGQRQKSRSSNGTSSVGTGLGLTIAMAIVRAHHGKISVASELGAGTTFTIQLPCL